jgi:hypothetical protein
MQSLTLPVDSGSDLALNTRRSVFQGFSNAIKRLFNIEAKASQLPQTFQTAVVTSGSLNQTFQTTATTSASLNQTFQTNAEAKTSLNAEFASAEFIPVEFASAELISVEFASAKFTPPPPIFSLFLN